MTYGDVMKQREMWWSNLQGDFNLRLETTSCRKGGLFAVSLNQSTCTPKGKGEAFKKQRRIIPLARNQTLFLFLPACLLKLTSLNLLQNPDENLFRSFHQLNAFDQLLLVPLEIYSKAMFFTDWSLFDALRRSPDWPRELRFLLSQLDLFVRRKRSRRRLAFKQILWTAVRRPIPRLNLKTGAKAASPSHAWAPAPLPAMNEFTQKEFLY